MQRGSTDSRGGAECREAVQSAKRKYRQKRRCRVQRGSTECREAVREQSIESVQSTATEQSADRRYRLQRGLDVRRQSRSEAAPPLPFVFPDKPPPGH